MSSENKIKISVIMVTYNSAEYLRNALDSIFKQTIKPNQVIIGDDCSTDDTISIIKSYQEQFPDIVIPVLNPSNLGVNKNLNNLLDFATGDIINFLAGDDFYIGNLFLEQLDIVHQYSLNPIHESFLIIPNVQHIYPGGRTELQNNFQKKNHNPFSLKLRNLIGSRYTGISNRLFKRLPKWNEEIGLWSDFPHSVDLFFQADQFYFINKPLVAYRIGAGISHAAKEKELHSSHLKALDFILESHKDNLSLRDKMYLQYEKARCSHLTSNNLSSLSIFFCLHLINFLNLGSHYKWVRNFFYFLPKEFRIRIRRIIYGRKN